VKRFVALVTAVVLCAGGGFWIYASINPAPRGPIPAASAPVATVADIYLKAAKDQDCGLTRALTTSNTWAWCTAPQLLNYDKVQAPDFSPARTSGVNEQCVAFMMDITASSDGSMQAGSEPWTYCVVHTSKGWRLWDQGQG
jgi:hypothetical protein